MSIVKKFLLFSILILSASLLFSQSLPRDYHSISLGMPLEATKEALKDRPEFGYHGERDVSLLPGDNKALITTDSETGLGSRYLETCYFQFHNDFLYIITINMNTEKMDYYSVFTKLCEKYGDPTSINPQQAKWENKYTTISLEKPLTLKFIDNVTFNKTLDQSQILNDPVEITKEMFLEDL